jgi:hypothetical protein
MSNLYTDARVERKPHPDRKTKLLR